MRICALGLFKTLVDIYSPFARLFPGRLSIAPEPGPAFDPSLLGYDFNIGIEFEINLARVAAADIELIEIGQHAKAVDGFADAAVPFLLADFMEGLIAQLLIVGLIL